MVPSVELQRLPLILISEPSNRSIERTKYTRCGLLESEASSRICAYGITIVVSRLETLSRRIEKFLRHVVDNGYTCISLDVGVIISISNCVDTFKLQFGQIGVCSRLHVICIIDVYGHALVAVPCMC